MMLPVDRELLALYDQLDAEIAQHEPACRACGACCNFPEQGFTLFATSAEVALVVAHGSPRPPWPDRRLCPYHVEGRCTIRPYRPLGCRTYFCGPALSVSGPMLYGTYHGQIKAILVRHAREYRYAPFLELLADAWG